jgi:hypothetical protein
VEERESNIGFCAPAFRDNFPIRTESKREIAVAVKDRPRKPAFLNQIADNEE